MQADLSGFQRCKEASAHILGVYRAATNAYGSEFITMYDLLQLTKSKLSWQVRYEMEDIIARESRDLRHMTWRKVEDLISDAWGTASRRPQGYYTRLLGDDQQTSHTGKQTAPAANPIAEAAPTMHAQPRYLQQQRRLSQTSLTRRSSASALMTTAPSATLTSFGLLVSNSYTGGSDICLLRNRAQYTNLLPVHMPMPSVHSQLVELHQNATSARSNSGKNSRNAAFTREELAHMATSANSATRPTNQPAHIHLSCLTTSSLLSKELKNLSSGKCTRMTVKVKITTKLQQLMTRSSVKRLLSDEQLTRS